MTRDDAVEAIYEACSARPDKIWARADVKAILDQVIESAERRIEDKAFHALAKIRAHTGYVNPTMELLQGLLASIERIADAALDARQQQDGRQRCKQFSQDGRQG